jgi:hypothetical protein
MRRLLVVALSAILLACSGGGGSGPTAPTTGAVVFKLDANTCPPILGTSPISVIFFIDGNTIGTAAVSTTQSSPAYTVSAGSHVLSARVANTTYFWGNTNVTVLAGQTFSAVMPCT